MWMMVLIGPSMFYSAYNIVDKWNSHLLPFINEININISISSKEHHPLIRTAKEHIKKCIVLNN